MSLAGRVALVTGGSHGLGKVIVQRLLGAGASVVFCGRNESDVAAAAAELARDDGGLAGMRADVANPEDARRLVSFTVSRFGSVDILVNNAGIYGPIGPAWENDPEAWIDAVRVNLCGGFLMCREVVPLLVRAGRGKIVNVAGGGASGPFPRFSAYAASKAALVRFTETLAVELAPHNVQVNAVAPGFIATRLHDQTLEAGDRAGADFLQKTKAELARGGADPALAVGLVEFLVSDEADQITGRFISAVWDNWSELRGRVESLAGTDIYTLRRIVPADRGMKS